MLFFITSWSGFSGLIGKCSVMYLFWNHELYHLCNYYIHAFVVFLFVLFWRSFTFSKFPTRMLFCIYSFFQNSGMDFILSMYARKWHHWSPLDLWLHMWQVCLVRYKGRGIWWRWYFQSNYGTSFVILFIYFAQSAYQWNCLMEDLNIILYFRER